MSPSAQQRMSVHVMLEACNTCCAYMDGLHEALQHLCHLAACIVG